MAFEWLSGDKTKDQNRSLNHVEGAKAEWNRLRDAYYGNPEEGILADPTIQPGALNFDPTGMSTESNTLRGYQAGPMQSADLARYLDPASAAAMGIQGQSAAFGDGGSNWAVANSAFDDMGPSSWDGYSSEFGNLGPSSFGDLQYDEQALSGMDAASDYYGGLMSTGSDPIAEADFQRRTAAAEASRRANTDAALAQLEQRGQGNANAGLLSELSNQQASVSDQYLAGLDANAMAAARRDSAAGSMANVADMRGRGMLAADTARAGGMDAYGLSRAAGMDQAGAARAAGQDAYGMNRAQGQDTFAGNRAAGMDAHAQYRMGLADDWAQKQYDNYYENQEFNAGQKQHVSDRNMDRTWGAQDANVDLWNQAATYNTVDRPQVLFDQRGQIATGGGNTRLGAATTYRDIAQQQDEKAQKLIETGKQVAGAAAKKVGI